jgi:hypothetical protein
MQRKYSQLHCKEIDECWYERTARQSPNYVGKESVQNFRNSCERKVADFCLDNVSSSGPVVRYSVEFATLDRDAHLENRVAHAIRLAEIIRPPTTGQSKYGSCSCSGRESASRSLGARTGRRLCDGLFIPMIRSYSAP